MKNQNNHIDPNTKVENQQKSEPFSFIDKDVKISDNCWMEIMFRYIQELELEIM